MPASFYVCQRIPGYRLKFLFIWFLKEREREKKMWQMVYETYCLVEEGGGERKGYVFSLSLGTSTSCLNFTHFLSFIYVSFSISRLNNDNHREFMYMVRFRVLLWIGLCPARTWKFCLRAYTSHWKRPVQISRLNLIIFEPFCIGFTHINPSKNLFYKKENMCMSNGD